MFFGVVRSRFQPHKASERKRKFIMLSQQQISGLIRLLPLLAARNTCIIDLTRFKFADLVIKSQSLLPNGAKEAIPYSVHSIIEGSYSLFFFSHNRIFTYEVQQRFRPVTMLPDMLFLVAMRIISKTLEIILTS